MIPKNNKPGDVSNPGDISENDENFDDYLEWTVDEEEAFMDIVNKQGDRQKEK